MTADRTLTLLHALSLAAALLILITPFCSPTVFATTNADRIFVRADADRDGSRILVRWNSLGGAGLQYEYFDLERRVGDLGALSMLNFDPIGPMTTVSQIEAWFQTPGREDALASIQESFGPGYASAILALAQAEDGSEGEAQLTLLPDLNYGAAVTLGLGYLDEDVVNGTTYVYELWGLDSDGFRVERLGRATATAGISIAIPGPTQTSCVDLGDVRGHESAQIRWTDSSTPSPIFRTGHDVYRKLANPDGTCPSFTLNDAGVMRANSFPLVATNAGQIEQGEALFNANCASCHAGGRDNTLLDAPQGIAGTTAARFVRSRDADLAAGQAIPHTTQSLIQLPVDDVLAIYDWVHEFQYRDDATGTTRHPVGVGERWCYQPRARDLLGQAGPMGSSAACDVEDKLPPATPTGLTSQLLDQGDHERCEIGWDRNEDDTSVYEIVRGSKVPRVLAELDAFGAIHAGFPLDLAQPGSGPRVTYEDTGLTVNEATETFYYAVRARDPDGNTSRYSGWVPCVPRDIVAPPPPQVSIRCCDDPPEGSCVDRSGDDAWIEAGGDPSLVFRPGECRPKLDCSRPGDTYGCRLERSWDGTNFLGAEDIQRDPISFDFEPLIDQKVFFQAKGFDASGNFSAASSAFSMIFKGKFKLPAPVIDEVALAAEDPVRVRIRFSSLLPESVIGFALYEGKIQRGFQTTEANAPTLVNFFDGGNIAPPLSPGSDQWVVKSTALPLDQRILVINQDPPNCNSDYLIYHEVEKRYYMCTEVDAISDLVLRMTVIGWSGEESYKKSYYWGGWQQGDGILDWPRFKTRNHRSELAFQALSVTYDAAGPAIDLQWNVAPYDCTDSSLYAVFRRRGATNRFVQVSPLFLCDENDADPDTIDYRDTDIEVGRDYRYRVMTLTPGGEFQMSYGPTDIVAE